MASDGDRERERTRDSIVPRDGARGGPAALRPLSSLSVWSSAAAPLLLVVLRPPLVCVRVLSPSLAPLSLVMARFAVFALVLLALSALAAAQNPGDCFVVRERFCFASCAKQPSADERHLLIFL